MKKILTLLLTIICTLTVGAQTALGVEKAFATYGHSKGCKMVEMHDMQIKGYKLKTYKSLTYSRYGTEIEAMLAEDKKQARKIREVVEDGVVTSGYYQMDARRGINRYVLFSKGAKGKGTLIYIEGMLKPEDIMVLCYGKNK
ncbi:MAG: hypothetical protein J1E57_07475 [Prevotella sp.]|nr:hypothetical protein [Prevotella sp.]